MDPFSQQDHDALVESFWRDLLVGVGIVTGVLIILIFG